MTTMADRILALIRRKRGGVSFVELDREIEGFTGGDNALLLSDPRCSNILLWGNVTEEGCNAINELSVSKLISFKPSSLLVYLVDGKASQLPIARRVRHYKHLHWLPVTIDPANEKTACEAGRSK